MKIERWRMVWGLLLLIPIMARVEAAEDVRIGELAIPESLGKIEERFVSKSPRWVIYIQDVHAHFTAQENTAAILDHLNAVYGIKTVAMEGSWSATSFPKSWGLPSSREKQMLARALLEGDHINGPAYAALFTQTPMNLIGIEDEKLYGENRQVYLDHLAVREETAAGLTILGGELATRKEKIFNPDLERFDLAISLFRDGKNAEKFIPSVLAMAQAKDVDLADLDQIQLFKKGFEIESALDKGRLESEAKRLMQSFKGTRLSFEELLRNGKFSAEKLEYYPSTQQYLELMKLQDQIRHRIFFAQIEEAINRLKEKLFTSEEERALALVSERFYLARKILMFEATPEDLAALEKERTALESEMKAAGLADAFNLALGFYDLAKQRDDVFFQKITSDARLSGDIAVVAGGFHTEGLSRRLEEAGISYIVISPDLANETADQKLYFERMRENFNRHTLSELQNKITDELDAAIAAAVEKLKSKKTNDLRSAVEIVKSYQPAKPLLEAPEEAVDFRALGKEEQSAIVQDLRRMQDGKLRINIVFRESVLKDLLADPLSRTVLEEEIFSRRENTVIILQESGEYLTETIGVKAQVMRVVGGDIESALGQKRFQDAIAKKALAVIDPDYQSDRLLVLPDRAASLLLLRALLEYNYRRINFRDAEILTILEALFLDRYSEERILRSV